VKIIGNENKFTYHTKYEIKFKSSECNIMTADTYFDTGSPDRRCLYNTPQQTTHHIPDIQCNKMINWPSCTGWLDNSCFGFSQTCRDYRKGICNVNVTYGFL